MSNINIVYALGRIQQKERDTVYSREISEKSNCIVSVYSLFDIIWNDVFPFRNSPWLFYAISHDSQNLSKYISIMQTKASASDNYDRRDFRDVIKDHTM